MTDAEFHELVAQLGMSQRRKVVRSLLAGNDTQCFTTQQYAEAYHRIVHRNDQDHKDGWIRWLVKLAPKHLKSVGMVEVKPGVGYMQSKLKISDIPHGCDFEKFYRKIAREAPHGATLVELGVWRGASLAILADELVRSGRDDVTVVGIDTWEGSAGEPDMQKEAAREGVMVDCIQSLRALGLLDHVALLHCDTIAAAHLLKLVDFVFHDSCHEENHVYDEIRAWRGLLKPSGIQAGHDWGHPGVRAAVQAFFSDAEVVGSCWVGKYVKN